MVTSELDFDNWLVRRERDVPANDGELAAGTIVGDYRIIALLGRGGFADVYRADGANGEAVAITMLHDWFRIALPCRHTCCVVCEHVAFEHKRWVSWSGFCVRPFTLNFFLHHSCHIIAHAKGSPLVQSCVTTKNSGLPEKKFVRNRRATASNI